jgi:adenylate cyclase
VPQEIERKFLVADDGWRAHASAGRPLKQAYLAETDKAVFRTRIADEAAATLTIKSAAPGLSRQEFEYELPVEHAEALLALRQGSVLEKTRFEVPFAGRTWEVDVYAGDNDGLVIAEVEIEAETAEVKLPPWVGREVTGEKRYYASQLAQNPYRAWPDAAARGRHA